MKFDVILANPPYSTNKNSNAWRDFVNKSFDVLTYNGTISMISPANYAGASPDSTQNKLLKEGLNVFKILDTNVFNVQLLISYFICSRKYKNSHVEVNNVLIDRSNLEFIPNSAPEMINILSKIKKNGHLNRNLLEDCNKGSLLRREVVLDDNGVNFMRGAGKKDGPIDTVKIKADLESTGYGTHKVVISGITMVHWLGHVKISDTDTVGGNSVMQIFTNNYEESKNLKSYLDSKFVKSLVQLTKSSAVNSKSIFKNIPKLDFSRSWSDEDLYNHFNLTRTEIQYIENLFN